MSRFSEFGLLFAAYIDFKAIDYQDAYQQDEVQRQQCIKTYQRSHRQR